MGSYLKKTQIRIFALAFAAVVTFSITCAVYEIHLPILKQKHAITFQDELSRWPNLEQVQDPLNWHVSKNSVQLISEYRGGPQRQGFMRAALPPHLSTPPVPVISLPFWNHGIHTASKSTPATDDSGFYVGSDTGEFAAFDWQGRRRWSYQVALSGRGIHSTAAVDQDSVYFGAYNGRLYSLNKSTGRMRWSAIVGDAIGSSVLLYRDRIFIATEKVNPADGFLACLDAKSGELLWRSRLFGEQAHSSPTLSEDGKTLYVGANDGSLFAIDEESGKIQWRFQTHGEIKSTPLVLNGSIYLTSWDENLYALNSQGQLEYKIPLSARSQSSVAYDPLTNFIFVADASGELRALAPKTGHEIWKRSGSSARITSPLVIVDLDHNPPSKRSVVITQCDQKRLCALSAKSGATLWFLDSVAELTSVPAYFNGFLLFSFDAPGPMKVLKWSGG